MLPALFPSRPLWCLSVALCRVVRGIGIAQTVWSVSLCWRRDSLLAGAVTCRLVELGFCQVSPRLVSQIVSFFLQGVPTVLIELSLSLRRCLVVGK